MSNRMFQGVIYQMKDAIGRVVGVTDEMGVVIACSELGQIDSIKDGVQAERMANSQGFVRGGYTFKGFSNNKRNDFYVFVEGIDENAERFASMLSISLQSIKQFHDEKFDRLNFMKNVVMDNIMPGDIYAKAREMHFVTDVPRVVLIIRVNQQKDMSTFDVIQNLFPDKQTDFVISINETDVALIKQLPEGADAKELQKIAKQISTAVTQELGIKVVIVYDVLFCIKYFANFNGNLCFFKAVCKVFDICYLCAYTNC